MIVGRSSLIACCVGLSVVGAGVAFASSASGVPAAHVPDDQVVVTSTMGSGVNDSGQTYGSALNVADPELLPDLVLAYADDGRTVGFVSSEDLVGPELTLEQVRALPTEVQADGTVVFVEPERTIPVYEVDGETVIGEYTIGD